MDTKKDRIRITGNYTDGNSDDIHAAIDGLNHFTKNWCMNVKQTTESNDLVFRCHECPFSGGRGFCHCLVKSFAYYHDDEYTRSVDFGAMGAE